MIILGLLYILKAEFEGERQLLSKKGSDVKFTNSLGMTEFSSEFALRTCSNARMLELRSKSSLHPYNLRFAMTISDEPNSSAGGKETGDDLEDMRTEIKQLQQASTKQEAYELLAGSTRRLAGHDPFAPDFKGHNRWIEGEAKKSSMCSIC